MSGALLVAGTTSEAGKSTVVAWLLTCKGATRKPGRPTMVTTLQR